MFRGEEALHGRVSVLARRDGLRRDELVLDKSMLKNKTRLIHVAPLLWEGHDADQECVVVTTRYLSQLDDICMSSHEHG